MQPPRALTSPLVLTLAVVATGCGSSGERTVRGGDPPPFEPGVATGPSRWVDPFIGTADAASPDPVGNGASGATFPGAALPFGMVQWSPDTVGASPPGYAWESTEFTGFSLTHLNGAGCQALRELPLMAGTEPPSADGGERYPLDHAGEVAEAGYYRLDLASGVRVELSATTRTGLGRFTFPEGARGHLWARSQQPFDPTGARRFRARWADERTLLGSQDGSFFCLTPARYTVHFALRVDRAPDEHGTWLDGYPGPDATGGGAVEGANAGVWLAFDTRERRVVQVEVGLSYVSAEAALANLEAERHGFDLPGTVAAARSAWDARLDAIAVEGGTDDERTSFYTALYHALVQPGVASDVTGTSARFDDGVRSEPERTRYQHVSGWDVYRSWVQLAAVVAPRETSDLMQSLLWAGEECGALPRWSLANDEVAAMVGDPATPTLAGAWAFGAREFAADAALAAMQVNATDPTARCNAHPSRRGLDDYQALGWVPHGAPGVWGPPATTLEYAVADAALARFAEAQGEAAMAATFDARAERWRNVLDPAVGLMQARARDGAFVPSAAGDDADFVEGNPAQYTFMVPHDPPGLFAALGGDAAAVARLDDLFTELNAGVSRPHFYMGNEPQFATPWLYVFAGAPHKTQAVVRRIQQELFAPTPAGLPGNDDLGATSAWLVWSMLGLYPVQPGLDVLVLGSPVFPEARVRLPGGGALVIRGVGAAADAPYVQRVMLAGAPLERAWVRWSELVAAATPAGGAAGSGTVELVFELGTTPNPAWGADPAQRPPLR